MKNLVKKSAKNNSLFVDFQAFVIDSGKQKKVKGGEDIIIQDVVES